MAVWVARGPPGQVREGHVSVGVVTVRCGVGGSDAVGADCRGSAVAVLVVVFVVLVVAQGGVHGFDGSAFEADADVGVDVGGGVDLGVAEELLDGDEFDSGLQEKRRAGVVEVVEADLADAGHVAQGLEVVVQRAGSTGRPVVVTNTCPTESRWAQTFFTRIKTDRARAAGPARALPPTARAPADARTQQPPAAITVAHRNHRPTWTGLTATMTATAAARDVPQQPRTLLSDTRVNPLPLQARTPNGAVTEA